MAVGRARIPEPNARQEHKGGPPSICGQQNAGLHPATAQDTAQIRSPRFQIKIPHAVRNGTRFPGWKALLLPTMPRGRTLFSTAS